MSDGPGAGDRDATARSAPRAARPRVGLLVDNLVDGYELEVWRGARLAAEAADATFLCFVGGTLSPEHGRNQVFELIGPENVDALVVLAGSIGYQVDAGARRAFVRGFAPLPVVTVGDELEGAVALLVDSGPAVERLVEHLVRDHGRRRIAFVRGPAESPEAEARYAAYRAALARLGAPFDPALVCEGNFERHAGHRAVEVLLDERRARFDAMVCANDPMALGALAELQRRGVDVPNEVAMVGFDDIADATVVYPPLSTARQPLERLGRGALELALACARGEAPAARQRFEAEPVLRRSCGCLPRAEVTPAAPAAPALTAAALAARLEEAFPWLSARQGGDCIGALAEAAVRAAEAGAADAFLETVERQVTYSLRSRADAGGWYEVVRTALALAGAGRAAAGPALGQLTSAALTLIGTLGASAQAAQRIRAASERQILRRVILPDLLGEAAFHEVLRAELPRLGIRSFFLARFAGGADQAQLACHYDHSGGVELADPAAPFASRRLVPGRLTPARRHAYAVLPLFARSERLGFALCELSGIDPSAYEALSNQISTVMKLNALLDEVRRNQLQLLDVARLAGMAEVASGVLHGVGNLLNSVRVSAAEIEALAAGRHVEGLARANALLDGHREDLAGFFARDPRAPLLPEYYAKLADALGAERQRLRAEARALCEGVDLVRDSVRALQAHARDPGEAGLAEPVDLAGLVDGVVRLEQGELDRHGIRVCREVPALPPLCLPRAKLVQVLVALVRNAIDALQDAPRPSRALTLRAGAGPGGGVRLEITDTGRGIAPEDRERVFAYGHATRSGDRGYGLHTAANTVGQLGGTLSADSAGPGRGATFTLDLPAEAR